MIDCKPFARPAPRGQPPPSVWSRPNVNIDWALKYGFIPRPNYLAPADYTAAFDAPSAPTVLDVVCYRRAVVGSLGAVICLADGLTTPHLFYHRPAFQEPGLRLVRAVSLKQCWDTAYYHWVIEVLPRLLAWEDDRATPLLIGDGRAIPSFVYEYLDLLGVARGRVVSVDTAAVDELLWPTYRPWNFYDVPREPVEALRGRLRPPTDLAAVKKEAILIQRTGGAPGRDITNHAAVGNVLSNFGYRVRVVDFGLLSVREQMAAAANAGLLIGAIGGAMTNMVWMPAGASVVEVHTPDFAPFTCYWNLAACSGLDYYTLFTGADRAVDLARLRDVLGSIIT